MDSGTMDYETRLNALAVVENLFSTIGNELPQRLVEDGTIARIEKLVGIDPSYYTGMELQNKTMRARALKHRVMTVSDLEKVRKASDREGMLRILFSDRYDIDLREIAAYEYIRTAEASAEMVRFLRDVMNGSTTGLDAREIVVRAGGRYVELERDIAVLRKISLDGRVPEILRLCAGIKYVDHEKNPNELRNYAGSPSILERLREYAQRRWQGDVSESMRPPQSKDLFRLKLGKKAFMKR